MPDLIEDLRAIPGLDPESPRPAGALVCPRCWEPLEDLTGCPWCLINGLRLEATLEEGMMADVGAQFAPLAVACGTCPARPGQYCTSRENPGYRTPFHAVRKRAAALLSPQEIATVLAKIDAARAVVRGIGVELSNEEKAAKEQFADAYGKL